MTARLLRLKHEEDREAMMPMEVIFAAATAAVVIDTYSLMENERKGLLLLVVSNNITIIS